MEYIRRTTTEEQGKKEWRKRNKENRGEKRMENVVWGQKKYTWRHENLVKKL